jgi:hypothetical protein
MSPTDTTHFTQEEVIAQLETDISNAEKNLFSVQGKIQFTEESKVTTKDLKRLLEEQKAAYEEIRVLEQQLMQARETMEPDAPLTKEPDTPPQDRTKTETKIKIENGTDTQSVRTQDTQRTAYHSHGSNQEYENMFNDRLHYSDRQRTPRPRREGILAKNTLSRIPKFEGTESHDDVDNFIVKNEVFHRLAEDLSDYEKITIATGQFEG